MMVTLDVDIERVKPHQTCPIKKQKKYRGGKRIGTPGQGTHADRQDPRNRASESAKTPGFVSPQGGIANTGDGVTGNE